MFRKFKLKRSGKERSSKSEKNVATGAAVPYKEPDPKAERRDSGEYDIMDDTPSSPVAAALAADTVSRSSSLSSSSLSQDGSLLVEAAKKSDIDGIRQLLRASVDVNAKDEHGNTALHLAAANGLAKVVRYLLLHGADVEIRTKTGKDALFLALEQGHTGTVGVLLDYMHSVDTRPRNPFVLLRGKTVSDKAFFVQRVHYCSELGSFKARDTDFIQLLVAHGQRATDMSVFLYSVLDVYVCHAFFQNTFGDLNMNNFQRFETRSKSQSVTILNTSIRVFDAKGYDSLKSLILVSCKLVKLTLEGLVNLELLDVRYNLLDRVPEGLHKCKELRTIRLSHNRIKRIPTEIGELKKLMVFEVSHNGLRHCSSSIIRCRNLQVLLLNNNDLLELPVDIGMLVNLDDFMVHNNKISVLPLSVSSMVKLRRISFHHNPLQNIPTDFPERAAEVCEYLRSLQDDPVPNRTVKLVLVGQEGVGKTTLLTAVKKSLWIIPKNPHTPKTEGINVKDIKVDDFILRCFDCGGDVDFNETHNFFITQGALYLACFNLSEYTKATVERNSFLLGRLQLWLQYIFSKVPNARVVIVGTHADHDSLKMQIFQQIWEQLRSLLVSAREHHQQYFRKLDRHSDCLLCQSDSKCLRRPTGEGPTGFVNLGYDDNTSLADETSFSEGPARVVSFPHIVGYYEVSSVKAMGNTSIFHLASNQSIEHLKDAIVEISKKIVEKNPEIPRKWANVQESLQNHIQMDPNHSVVRMDDIREIAAAQGVTSRTELINMLHFLKAQGHLLFFPNTEDLEDLVVLDPEWLAKIFASVVSFRDTGINNEGFMETERLKATWSHLDSQLQEKILGLLHYFGVCLPIEGTHTQLFPTKLPIGDPDDSVWPIAPSTADNQLTYSVTFPSLIPPPFFSDLIVTVFRHRAPGNSKSSQYFANQIIDSMNLEKIGCRDCGIKSSTPDKTGRVVVHKVHFELIAHRRLLQVTIRGQYPCCMVKRINRLLNRVTRKYEGLGTIDLDTILCCGCYMQKHRNVHRYSAKVLLTEMGTSKVVCQNKHTHTSATAILKGKLNEACLPYATIKPKVERQRNDYSGCPKLFIMLPVNKDGLSFDQEYKLFASSVLFDGFAVHLLCEFPDGYHLTNMPGYRLRRPQEFVRKYGIHSLDVLRLLSHVVESSVVSFGNSKNKSISNQIDDLVKDLKMKFKELKEPGPPLGAQELAARINERGLLYRRDELCNHLHVVDKPDSFGPLRRLKYADGTMWLCNEHYRQMRVISLGLQEAAQADATTEA